MVEIVRHMYWLRRIIGSVVFRTKAIWSSRVYLKILYWTILGQKLNLNNPTSFGEKIQWLKLYNHVPLYSILVDKIEVKKWVINRIGSEFVIPTLGVWDSPNEIDYNNLPDKFVLKTNHDSGGLYICKNKYMLNKSDVNAKLKKSLKRNYYLDGREWPYKNIKRRILAESLLETFDGEEIKDYKFFCFDGVVKYCQVIQDRSTHETIDFFDTSWHHMPFVGFNQKCSNSINCPTKPDNFEKMIELAKILSEGIPFVRVDFYNIQGVIYFGEMTFYPAGGFGILKPEEWNEIIGDMINLKNDFFNNNVAIKDNIINK